MDNGQILLVHTIFYFSQLHKIMVSGDETILDETFDPTLLLPQVNITFDPTLLLPQVNITFNPTLHLPQVNITFDPTNPTLSKYNLRPYTHPTTSK